MYGPYLGAEVTHIQRLCETREVFHFGRAQQSSGSFVLCYCINQSSNITLRRVVIQGVSIADLVAEVPESHNPVSQSFSHKVQVHDDTGSFWRGLVYIQFLS